MTMPPGSSNPLILIVAYESDPQLTECLRNLDPGADVFVFDNGACDATAELCRRFGARYEAAERNLGFAAGVNAALRRRWDGRQDVLLLNPDARVSRTEVAELSRFLHASSNRAATGPRLVDDSGNPARAQWPFPGPAQAWIEALGLSRLWCGASFVVGAVLLIKGAALAEIGPLTNAISCTPRRRTGSGGRQRWVGTSPSSTM